MKTNRHLFAQAAGLGGLTLLSGALGFGREILIARNFGATHATDAYLVAIAVPVLIYALFFGSGLNVSLVPRLAVLLRQDQLKGRAVFAQFLSGAGFWGAVVSCLVLFLPAIFVRVFAPGLAQSAMAIEFLRTVSPLLFLFVVTYALGSFHCANDQVSHCGLIPVVHNII